MTASDLFTARDLDRINGVRRRLEREVIGDAPANLDQEMARIRRLPRWMGWLVMLLAAGFLWAGLITAVIALLNA